MESFFVAFNKMPDDLQYIMYAVAAYVFLYVAFHVCKLGLKVIWLTFVIAVHLLDQMLLSARQEISEARLQTALSDARKKHEAIQDNSNYFDETTHTNIDEENYDIRFTG